MNTSLLDTLLAGGKEYYSIGEVSRVLGVKPYVLRYWESQFGALRPARRGSGQRKFTRKDVETIFKIRELLYEKRFTIEGAKKHLRNRDVGAPPTHDTASAAGLSSGAVKEIKEGLTEILGLLRSRSDSETN